MGTIPIKVQELFGIRTASYEPPVNARPTFQQTGLPLFSIRAVEMMRRDPQVKLGLSIKAAPYLKVKYKIEGDPKQVEFIRKTLSRVWNHLVPKAILAQMYQLSAGELVWRRNAKTGQIEFRTYQDVYPTDVRILHASGVPVGINVYGRTHGSKDGIKKPVEKISLLGPKHFLYFHRREFNALRGTSELEGAFPPWIEKTDPQGALASRALWFHKYAFTGGHIYHPVGSYQDPDDPNALPTPYSDIARASLENGKNGMVMTFTNEPASTEAPGLRAWEYVPAAVNGDGKPMLEYPRELDTEILRGMEIPDDVVQQVGGTGSYAGRTIPLVAFFESQSLHVRQLFDTVDQLILPWALAFNGMQPDYEISEFGCNVDALIPDQDKPAEKSEEEHGQDVANQALTNSQKPEAHAVEANA